MKKEYNNDYALLIDKRENVKASKDLGDGFFICTFATVAIMLLIYMICWVGWVEGGVLPYWFGRVSTGWALPFTLSVLGGILHWVANRLDVRCKDQALKLEKRLELIQEMD